jgi:hypothetical protein
MKRGFYFLLMMLGTIVFISSCGSSTRTYTEMLKDERKAIKRLINSEGIKLLDEYPEDGVFGENEFYQLSSGLYINVVDSGNGNRAVYGTTEVSCRFVADFINVLSDTTYVYDGTAMGIYPLTFIYGASSATSGTYYYFYGSGVSEALQYVGDSSTVKLIVPFKIGGEAQSTGGDPVYFRKLNFRFVQN